MKSIEIAEKLKSLKIKVTEKRVVLFSVLFKSKKPLDVQTILSLCRKEVDIDLVTLYRNLKVFEENKIISSLNFKQGKDFYEFSLSENHHHHHAVCNGCGLIEELDHCLLDDFIKTLMEKTKEVKFIKSHSFEIFGLCQKCQK
jgi:Fur family ferric uptake transcriptional regulator